MFHVKHQKELEDFAALLLRWNRTINLIARRDEPQLWQRHIEDSLQLIPLLDPMPARAIDLGSGGGFPGLVVCIATGIPFDLIESDQRKCAFLREAARLTGAPATVHACRIEVADVAPAPLITARALAPLDQLCALVAPKLAPGGTFLALKGANAAAELTAAKAKWHMQVESLPSRTNPEGAILRIRQLAPIDPA